MLKNNYISLSSLVTRLGLPKKFLNRLAYVGDIPSLNVDGRLRFDEGAVRSALAKRAGRQRKQLHGGVTS